MREENPGGVLVSKDSLECVKSQDTYNPNFASLELLSKWYLLVCK